MLFLPPLPVFTSSFRLFSHSSSLNVVRVVHFVLCRRPERKCNNTSRATHGPFPPCGVSGMTKQHMTSSSSHPQKRKTKAKSQKTDETTSRRSASITAKVTPRASKRTKHSSQPASWPASSVSLVANHSVSAPAWQAQSGTPGPKAITLASLFSAFLSVIGCTSNPRCHQPPTGSHLHAHIELQSRPPLT